MSLDGVHLFPVRHHSPRAARALHALLDAVRPAVVLVEGPEDALELLPQLTDPACEPPVAILAYRTDGQPQSCFWPFASYSPEFAALRWAARCGAQSGFVDWPAGIALAEDSPGGEPPAADDLGPSKGRSHWEELAQRRGMRSFEEFWEASFEAPDYDPATFSTALEAFAEYVGAQGPRERSMDLRDAWMARRIMDRIEAGTPPDRIVAVLGAAHVAALRQGRFRLELNAEQPAPLPAALTLIPFSYPRLSEQSGYGAGNRAPFFYERAFGAGVDYARATLETLLAFGSDLRLRGFSVSLADSIEAYRLARTLAAVRGKSMPGLDEVKEAAQATLTRGERAPIEAYLTPQLIGRRIGRLGTRSGRNPLQLEFWAALDRFGLPRVDEPVTATLRLNDPRQSEASVFLHRLRVADVPYAVFLGSQQVSTRARAGEEAPGGFGALRRVREHWEAQWTPATDAVLIERIVYGERLPQVCERRLGERLEGVTAAGAASDLLVDAVLTDAREATARALAALDRASIADEDVASLAGAARTLGGLCAYGTSRPALEQAAGTVERLFTLTYTRAILRLDLACRGDAEATAPARGALRTLHELALSSPRADRAAWFAAARTLAEDDAIEATTAGVAAALLHLARELDEGALLALLARRVGDVIEPARAAAFLEGFLSVNALVLVKNRAIVAALDGFLAALPADQFRAALPALRRAFAGLGASERRFLLEQVLGLRGGAPEAKAVLAAPDSAALKELGGSIAAALDDLDDLL